MKAALRAAAAAAAVVCLGGCFGAAGRISADEQLSAEQVRGIRRGVTTKREILERFGPPLAVARRGSAGCTAPAVSNRGRGDMQPCAFFELFAPGRGPRDPEVLYYYDSSRVDSTGFVVLLGGGFHVSDVVAMRLWILIDERSGVVEDYVFRSAE